MVVQCCVCVCVCAVRFATAPLLWSVCVCLGPARARCPLPGVGAGGRADAQAPTAFRVSLEASVSEHSQPAGACGGGLAPRDAGPDVVPHPHHHGGQRQGDLPAEPGAKRWQSPPHALTAVSGCARRPPLRRLRRCHRCWRAL